MEKPKLVVVSFSGGKDSTAMLLKMLERGEQVDVILFCDTGLEFPQLYDHIRKVEQQINRKITTVTIPAPPANWNGRWDFPPSRWIGTATTTSKSALRNPAPTAAATLKSPMSSNTENTVNRPSLF